MFLSFHHHTFGSWVPSALNHHPWKHAKEEYRSCECGEREYRLLELFCSTKHRTGEYCRGCQPYASIWENRTLDTRVNPIYNEVMAKYKTGIDYTKPLTKRNEALFVFMEDPDHTYEDAAKKFGITRARAFQIVKRIREKEKQPA